MFIDTHCHLSSEDYDDLDLVVKEDEEAGVNQLIISGCTRDSIVEALSLIKKYKNVYATIGYHPSEAKNTNSKDIMLLEEQIKEDKVVGIGEIGLDYHYGKDDILQQQDLFRKQLALADKYHLPVVIHSRDATNDTINILKEFPNVRGDIHCFSGSLESAKIYIDMGYMLGIGGVITFKNNNLVNIIKDIGIDNILLETDSPYLTPEPFRGKKNSSKYISNIALKIAEVFGISIEEVSEKILNNTYRLFDLK